MTAALPLSLFASERVYARIYPQAVANNLAVLKRTLARDGGAQAPRIWATVKADAYGHGVAQILPGLRDADGLAVMHLTDAHICRDAGWYGPILVMAGLAHASEIALLDMPGLHLLLSRETQLQWLAAAPVLRAPPAVWLRFRGDIGMIGFDADTYRQAFAQCLALASTGRIGAHIGHLNHFGSAERADGIDEACARFTAVVHDLPGPRSTSNSAAIMRHQVHAVATDWVRPGLTLYGASPLADRTAADLGLLPAMSLHARILDIRTLAAGDRLGYGGSFKAPMPMTVGLVNCGYADGYPRHAPAGTPVIVAGQLTRTLGAVTMDLMTVDLTGLIAVVGAPVVLWGDPALPVERVAAAMGTIAAELLTGLTRRVPLLTVPMR
ncbi:alanine racemase [Alcaligenaceae bacterium B3P038]|nr:alanine racemase [Alcaligenaceae bacterium B3P038]